MMDRLAILGADEVSGVGRGVVPQYAEILRGVVAGARAAHG